MISKPTTSFIWQVIGNEKVLQQAWQDMQTGDVIWIDIPMVDQDGKPLHIDKDTTISVNTVTP
jgi:hypothetical protein